MKTLITKLNISGVEFFETTKKVKFTQKPWSCIPTLNHGYWDVKNGLGLSGKLIKFRYSEVMEKYILLSKEQTHNTSSVIQKGKRNWSNDRHVLLILCSNNKNPIIIAENLAELSISRSFNFSVIRTSIFFFKWRMWKRKKQRKEEKKDQNIFSGTWVYKIWLRQIHQIKFSQHSVHWDSGSMWLKFSPVWMATCNLSVYFNFKQIELFSYTSGWSLIVPKMTDKELSPQPLNLTNNKSKSTSRLSKQPHWWLGSIQLTPLLRN